MNPWRIKMNHNIKGNTYADKLAYIRYLSNFVVTYVI